MKPSDLRALLEKAKHRPEVYLPAVLPSAELLIELWEKAEAFEQSDYNREWYNREFESVLDRLRTT